NPSNARSSGEAAAATRWRAPRAGRGAPSVARMRPRSSRRSLEQGYSRVALEPEGKALGIFRVVQYGNNFLAEIPRRHRCAEAGEICLDVEAHRSGIRIGAGITDPGAADDLLGHDRLEADPEVLLFRDAVGVFGHEPEHALGAGVAARHRRSVHGRAARPHQHAAPWLERQV